MTDILEINFTYKAIKGFKYSYLKPLMLIIVRNL